MTEIWHLRGSLLSYPGKEIISSLISDDKKNYEKAERDFKEDIALLDNALALYVSVIQGAYSVKERWQHQSTYEAPIILLSSVLNMLILIRHAILLGYFSEIPALFRNCHEGITRSFLFWIDESEAGRFLLGKTRSQEEIDDKLSALGEPKEKGKRAAYIAQRKQYKNLSAMTHPNLTSFKFRYGDLEPDTLKEKIIDFPIWGGLLSDDLFKPVMHRALQTTLFAISIIKSILRIPLKSAACSD